MFKILLICGLTFIALIAHAQPDILWAGTYGVFRTRGESIVLTANGDFVIAGQTTGIGEGGFEQWLSRINSEGEELWWHHYGDDNDNRCTVHIQCTDGGFALAGTNPHGGRPYFALVKTDEEGEEQWTQTYVDEALGNCYALVQTGDGGFALAGRTSIVDMLSQILLLRTDEDGEELWSQTYGGLSGEACYSIIQNDDNGFAFAGSSSSFREFSADFYFICTDEEGEELWSQTYGGNGGENCYIVIQTQDGGYALAGYTQSFGEGMKDFWLVKTDENGGMEWSETYGGEADDVGRSVIQTADGGFVLGGTTESFGAGGEDFWLIRTNEIGEVFWSRTFGGESDDELFDVIENSNGGYALTGGTFSFEDEDDRGNCWLVVTEPDPVQPCLMQGLVLDAANDIPLEAALVTASNGTYANTDSSGFWRINIALAGDFDLTASLHGYNDSTLIDMHLDVGDTLEANFRLLHPEFMLSVDELNAELRPWEEVQRPFNLHNEGNGPLQWNVKSRLAGEAGADPWELRRSLQIGRVLEDSLLLGVAFIDNQYYVTGGGNVPNLVYVLNSEGDLVESFEQFGETEFGMRDLAWDDELLWGAEGEMIFGFTPDGELMTSFEGPFNSTSCIAWDSDRERLWISGISSDIGCYDLDGNQYDGIQRQGLRIFGLAYRSDDPDGNQLYILDHPDESRNVIHKVNLENHDVLFVQEFETEPDQHLLGAFFTDQYDIYNSCVNLSISDTPDGDRIDIIQVKANTEWMIPDLNEGVVNPEGVQELVLTLNSEGLAVMPWAGELLFTHNAAGGQSVLPVILDVNLDVTEKNRRALPTEFAITGIHPNPFNSTTTIEYALPFLSQVSLNIYNLSGRRIETLFNGSLQAGIHRVNLSAADLPSGLYFIKLKSAGKTLTGKVLLIR